MAPKIVEVVTEVINDIYRKGVGVLLVEQKMSMAFKVAQNVLIMGHGDQFFSARRRHARQRRHPASVA